VASIYTGFSDTDCNDLLNYWFQGSLLSTLYVGLLTALPTDSVGDGLTEPWILAPTITTITSVSTGGSLAAGARYYKITAVNTSGETTPSPEVLYTVPAGTSTNVVTVSWGAVTGAVSYNIYESSSSGVEAKIASGISTTYFQDTGPDTGGGGVPSSNTTGYGYLRVAVTANATNFPNAAGRSISNGTAITFPAPVTQAWSTIVGWCVFDGAQTTANPRVMSSLLVPVTPVVGVPNNFPPGTLVCFAPTLPVL
jgi:hypothetical protein